MITLAIIFFILKLLKRRKLDDATILARVMEKWPKLKERDVIAAIKRLRREREEIILEERQRALTQGA